MKIVRFLSRTTGWCLWCLLLSGCSRQQEAGPPFAYDLSQPALVKSLPAELKEISALAVNHRQEIVCVQDEKGSVYVYDLDRNAIMDRIEFGKDQDYEGISLDGSTLYILKSTGNIFEVHHARTGRQQTIEYQTFLKRENDTEGLCYDPKGGRLLVSCKGSPDYKKRSFPAGSKAIYYFDLQRKKFGADPAFVLRTDSVRSYMQRHFSGLQRDMVKVEKELFAPSEIALNPVDGNLYVLCSVGRLLLVVDGEGRVVYATPLGPKYFPHPEGIAFYANGDMLISNEGNHKRPANILKFPYHRPKS
ncbi:hypothetical protein V9K67_26545 [Paraflavisolibacter sp. H34]|uniref:hypothetical protein n=1 Tax=Huijunlia imazamoxiresistens TaxID=3127457 RepID=UPI0030166296